MILNGHLPDALLSTLGTDASGRPIRLVAAAAASLERISRDSGIPLGPASIADSYRDYDRQVAYRRNPPNHAGLAAKPGTSNHGDGTAIDARGPLIAWMAAHGGDYGWVADVPGEPWHWHYVGGEHPQSTPILEPLTRRSRMRLIRNDQRGFAVVGPGYRYGVPNMEQVGVCRTLWGDEVTLTTYDWDLAWAMAVVGQDAGAVDVQALAHAVAAALPAGQSPTVGAIADELAKRLAK